MWNSSIPSSKHSLCDLKGEVQTSCAIYLVAGHVLGLSDEDGQMLVEAYLEQLERRRLSGVAASIRQSYAGTRSQTLVRDMAHFHDAHRIDRNQHQSETVIQSRCGRCRKSVEFEANNATWFCESCKAALITCVIW